VLKNKFDGEVVKNIKFKRKIVKWQGIIKPKETINLVNIAQAKGKLISIWCKIRGSDEFSRHSRYTIRVDGRDTIRAFSSNNPSSYPPLHIDHISGTDTPHFAIASGLLKPPWVLPSGKWGVSQHNPKKYTWEYWATNSIAIDQCFTSSFSIDLTNPSNYSEEVDFISVIELNDAPEKLHYHELWYSYLTKVKSNQKLKLKGIEGTGRLEGMWLHITSCTNFSHKFKKLIIGNRKYQGNNETILDCPIEIFVDGNKTWNTPISLLPGFSIKPYSAILTEEYGIVQLNNGKEVDMYSFTPKQTFGEHLEIHITNVTKNEILVWTNVWVKRWIK